MAGAMDHAWVPEPGLWLLERAAATTNLNGAIIAVVDRNGTILGVRVESGVSPQITDNTTNLVFAIDGAVSLARHLDARLTLLHVMERGAPTSVHGQRHLTAIAEADQYLAAVGARARAAGVDADLHVHPNPEGNVPQSIVARARQALIYTPPQ